MPSPPRSHSACPPIAVGATLNRALEELAAFGLWMERDLDPSSPQDEPLAPACHPASISESQVLAAGSQIGATLRRIQDLGRTLRREAKAGQVGGLHGACSCRYITS